MKRQYPVALNGANQNQALQNQALVAAPAPLLRQVPDARQPIGANARFNVGAKVHFQGRHTRARVFPLSRRLATPPTATKGLLLDIHI